MTSYAKEVAAIPRGDSLISFPDRTPVTVTNNVPSPGAGSGIAGFAATAVSVAAGDAVGDVVRDAIVDVVRDEDAQPIGLLVLGPGPVTVTGIVVLKPTPGTRSFSANCSAGYRAVTVSTVGDDP
ncbi:MAG: hypothetical protein ABJD07_17585 [Gemmatimonadaceae bacterium]